MEGSNIHVLDIIQGHVITYREIQLASYVGVDTGSNSWNLVGAKIFPDSLLVFVICPKYNTILHQQVCRLCV